MRTANETTDRRRYGVIETRFRQHGRVATYNLTVNGEVWACVGWMARAAAWCVQDASGRCLAHCDAIHGEHIDAPTAVQLAKTMIRDGRMPTPEDAAQQHGSNIATCITPKPTGNSQPRTPALSSKGCTLQFE